MNKVNAVMVGGLFDENGISAFARPVLFGTAGDAMRDELPDAVEACFFAHDDREPAVAGAQDIALDAANRFASLAALPESRARSGAGGSVCAGRGGRSVPSGGDAPEHRLRRQRTVCRAAGL